MVYRLSDLGSFVLRLDFYGGRRIGFPVEGGPIFVASCVDVVDVTHVHLVYGYSRSKWWVSDWVFIFSASDSYDDDATHVDQRHDTFVATDRWASYSSG